MKYTLLPSWVTARRCSFCEAPGGMAARWTMVAPFLSAGLLPLKMSPPDQTCEVGSKHASA